MKLYLNDCCIFLNSPFFVEVKVVLEGVCVCVLEKAGDGGGMLLTLRVVE